jgi:uncharacterized protein YukE
MSDQITYHFAENRDGLDHVQRAINDIHGMADDIHSIFNALPDLYDGEQQQALQARHQQISQKLEDILHDLEGTKLAASDQQDEMEALDHKLAGGF